MAPHSSTLLPEATWETHKLVTTSGLLHHLLFNSCLEVDSAGQQFVWQIGSAQNLLVNK